MNFRYRFHVAVFLVILLFNPADALSAERVYECDAEENRTKPATVEILLSKKWKGKDEEVKQSFIGTDETLKVRIKFFPFLEPPTNIGIGKCVTAENARAAIREGMKYNGKIDRLIMQDIMPHHWIKIGTTDTSELTWIPIEPDELGRLTDPALSTDEFHELYRQLARQTEKRLPFGMGTRKLEEKQ